MKCCRSFHFAFFVTLFAVIGCGDSPSPTLTSSDVGENPFADRTVAIQSNRPNRKSKRRNTRTVTKQATHPDAGEPRSDVRTQSPSELTGSYGLVGERDQPHKAKKQDIAPPRKEHPLASLLGQPTPKVDVLKMDGDTCHLRQRRSSKILLLVFWASYNPLCENELSILQRIAADYADKDVELLAVNDGENKKTIQAFLTNHHLTIPVGIDVEQQVADLFHINQLPCLAIIDKSGIVQSIHAGFIEMLDTDIKQDLDALLDGGNIVTKSRQRLNRGPSRL